ncbi:late embryogenesis abundant protein D-34-like [Cynara cardunculus var. scolymus]|uniref:late embryogenesis abundant protein D-34-like n=1 Tax=Cynara cardunculus var. scolymus TaxID=59895 RepID=UPI000D6235A8|nr:late embryogenesis abundant protein D-34-like [Cynara cardunculus var. scolymus]
MSQEQPRRSQEEPIKYGDVFNVSGKLANKPITPQDAADMQAAETKVLGQTVKGGPAAVMQSTANVNENRGLVGRYDDQGIAVSDTEYAGHQIITESVGGEVVGQYVRPNLASSPAPAKLGDDAVTIGEALEATVMSAGSKLVDQADAAAIQAAEVRATGRMQAVPGGVAARAQAAAAHNARTKPFENKTKLGDVLADATKLLPEDKPVTRVDAEAVIEAEIRNKPNLATTPGGVASAVDAAAKINQQK